MANTIRHKRGTTTPAAGSLVTGELAINTTTGTVFTKTDGGSVVALPNSDSPSFTGDLTTTGAIVSTASAGDEGGEIRLATATTNSTLSTSVTIDVYQNKLRIFETGGTSRGAYIDLSAAGASVGSNLLSGGGTASWGTISGTLSSQSDLNSALGLKANLAGATFTGGIVTAAPTTAGAFFNLPHGAQPTTPVNGDLYTTTSGLFARINGTTLQYAAINATSLNFGGTTLSFGTSTAASTINVASGATTTGVTKTLNLATGALAGATTAVNIGSATGTSTITLNGTVNATGLVNGAKAWVNFNGTGTVAIASSYNVSSITDVGVGTYTVNFTTALASATFAVIGNAGNATSSAFGFQATARAVGSVGVLTRDTSAGSVVDLTSVSVAVLR